MGKGRRTSDPVFRTHSAYYGAMERMADCLLIENVPEYNQSVVEERLGSEWEVRGVVFDPRVLGLPAARSRRYLYALKKSRVRWNSDIKLEDVIDALTSSVVRDAGMWWWDDLPRSSLTAAQAV